ncbi:MAG: acyltransferase [Oscillospiraceae bacterium]|jgi:surface polysaccharide O-acyltransferase-like enzyme|nr:acyltransferase [Oscillospiraceae bacterium]
MQTKKPPRQSNFELLRILVMLMIIANHLIVHAGSRPETSVYIPWFAMEWWSRFVTDLLQYGGKVGVDCFILISGYFLAKPAPADKRILPKDTLTRVGKVYGQVVFYCTFFLVASLLLKGVFRPGAIADANYANVWFVLTPFTSEAYWFTTAYIILMLIAPFLNKLIAVLSQKEYAFLLAVLLVVFSVIPSLKSPMYDVPMFLWFAVLYLLAGYLRAFPPRWFGSRWPALALAVLSYPCIWLYMRHWGGASPAGHGVAESLADTVNGWLGFSGNMERAELLNHSMAAENKVVTIFCALCLFTFFRNLKLKPNRLINAVAGTTFGVYLFHNNPFVRPFLWKYLFPYYPYYSQPLKLLCWGIGVTCLVFCMGMVFEFFRQYALARPMGVLLGRLHGRKESKEASAVTKC